eukprot:6010662-Pyramimonas_sp.AAC.1
MSQAGHRARPGGDPACRGAARGREPELERDSGAHGQAEREHPRRVVLRRGQDLDCRDAPVSILRARH